MKTNNTKNINDDELLKIKLKSPENYISDFKTIKNNDSVELKRWLLPNDFLLNQLKNIDDDELSSLIEFAKSPVDDDNKLELLKTIKSFFNDNPVLTISIKDKNKINQIALIIWHKKVDNNSGLIKIKKSNDDDKDSSFYRFILTNENLDKSYGTQAENPRIKISAVINSILNYQIFSSCENQGHLLYDSPIFINNLIDDSPNKFIGENIINRGYYDSPDYFGKSKKSNDDDSNDDDDSGDDESIDFDF